MIQPTNLWRFSIRALSRYEDRRNVSEMYAVLYATTETDAVKEIKEGKFTSAWWEGYLILDVTSLGELWYVSENL